MPNFGFIWSEREKCILYQESTRPKKRLFFSGNDSELRMIWNGEKKNDGNFFLPVLIFKSLFKSKIWKSQFNTKKNTKLILIFIYFFTDFAICLWSSRSPWNFGFPDVHNLFQCISIETDTFLGYRLEKILIRIIY